MASQSIKFGSLFSGCGGFDLGFISQGFQPVGAYDFDKNSVLNYKENICQAVYEVNLMEKFPVNQELFGVDALIAGPPCQGFSTAGKRRIDDERNHLLVLTGILALKVQPKVLVVENVNGSLSGAHAQYWHQLNMRMRLAGYSTHMIRCQASELGMSQLRKRVLFFAWRTGRDIRFECPSLPSRNLEDVLANVRGTPNHRPCRLKKGTPEWDIARKIRPGQKLSNVRGGSNSVASWDIPEVFGEVTEHERTVLEMLRSLRRRDRRRTYGDADPVSQKRLEAALGLRFKALVNSLIKKRYVRRVKGGVDLVGTFNGKFRRLKWDGLSCTVDTRFGSPRYFLHPSYHRGFTVREAARIQGFEDNYMFVGNEKAHYKMIGNAVPPPLGNLAATFTQRLLSA